MPKAPAMTIANLSPELQTMAEVLACERSHVHWLVNHGIVEIREVGLKPFKEVAWPFQLSFSRLLQERDRIVVLKARQIGVSTLIMHFAYWKIRFGKPNSEHVLVLSKSKEDAANVLMAKIPVIHANQPDAMRMDIQSQNSYRFVLSNGNSITVLAATEAGGRGHAATMIVLDEHAFHQAAEMNWAALQPTLEGGGKFFVVSTGNGIGNLFHDLYEKAKEGRNSFTPVFISWDAPSHRDEEWLEAQKADSVTAPELFKQEYPADDNEAFAQTGTSPFDLTWVRQRYEASLAVTPETRHGGRTRIWSRPEPGVKYAAGLDVAQGITRKGVADDTYLVILDQYDRQVAAWSGKLELADAAREVYELLSVYRPFLCPERNGAGAGFIAALQALGFDNFYRYNEQHLYPDAQPTKNPLIGLQRTQAVKTRQVGMLTAAVNSRALQSSDETFWRQCSTFIQKAPMQWGPQGKNKDDGVDAMSHALWALQHMPKSAPRRKSRKIRWR